MQLPIDYDSSDWRTRRAARIQYVREQNNKCLHCGASLTGPPAKSIVSKPLNMRLFPFGFLDSPVHLHHDRKTGLTIGAVHARCNGVLWQYHGE